MSHKKMVQLASNSSPEELGKKILFRKPSNKYEQLADKPQVLEQANIDKTELNKSANNSILIQDVSTQFLSLETLNQELRDWENDPKAKGNKQEAIQRIRQSFESREGVLNLEDLELNSLPTIIGQFNWIQELNIEKNQLKILPTAIFQLTQLKRLYLSANQLEILSGEIGQLNQLKWLHIENNKLQSLPNEINNLVVLRVLAIENNPSLQNVASFLKIPKLKIFQ